MFPKDSEDGWLMREQALSTAGERMEHDVILGIGLSSACATGLEC